MEFDSTDIVIKAEERDEACTYFLLLPVNINQLVEPPDLSNNQLCYKEQKGKRELPSKYLLRKLR